VPELGRARAGRGADEDEAKVGLELVGQAVHDPGGLSGGFPGGAATRRRQHIAKAAEYASRMRAIQISFAV